MADMAQPDERQEAALIKEIIEHAKVIAVVGLSPNPARPSHGVAAYLQAQGFTIIPVNPLVEEVLGEKCYASLRDVPVPLDIVDVFRQSDAVPAIARDAVAIGAKALWTQFDVISEEGAEIARRGGLTVIMDRCLKVEHAALKRD